MKIALKSSILICIFALVTACGEKVIVSKHIVPNSTSTLSIVRKSTPAFSGYIFFFEISSDNSNSSKKLLAIDGWSCSNIEFKDDKLFVRYHSSDFIYDFSNQYIIRDQKGVDRTLEIILVRDDNCK